ncbi:MAG: PAS domain-containing protein [Kiloniellaceae bacterium]
MTADSTQQQTSDGRAGAIADPRLALLLEYWLELREGDLVPPRSAVDPSALPADLRPLLPHFFLYEVIPLPVLDYRMRLAGSMLCATVGYEMRGKMFDEIHPLDQAAAIRREFDEVVRSGRPHYAERSAQWLPDKELPYRRLLLPFADDGVTVDSLGGASVFALDQRPPF